MATRTDKRTPSRRAVTRTPVHDTAALIPSKQADKVAGQDQAARMELALAEALTGGDLAVAAEQAGVSKSVMQRALRQAQRDQYAVRRDKKRLRVINRMYDTMQQAVEKIATELSNNTELTLSDMLSVVDRLGLRLAAVENLRTSVAEELAGSGADKGAGVQRTRKVIETVRASGAITAQQRSVLDDMLGISGLPSGAAPAPAGVAIDVDPDEVYH